MKSSAMFRCRKRARHCVIKTEALLEEESNAKAIDYFRSIYNKKGDGPKPTDLIRANRERKVYYGL
jgi:hypothetical protein